MPDVYEAKDVAEGITHLGQAWNITFTKPDGSDHHFIIPKFAFASQALEYDLDLNSEFELVVDGLLHSLWVPPTWEIKNDNRDPGFAAGYKTTIPMGWEILDDDSRTRRPVENQLVAGTLWTAETIKDAREAQDLRVQYVKDNKILADIDSLRRRGLNKLYTERNTPHPKGNTAHRDHVKKRRKQVRGREDGNPLKPGKVSPIAQKR